MSLQQTLIDLNKEIGEAKAAGDQKRYEAVGNQANRLLLEALANLGYTKQDAAKAVFTCEIYRERKEKLYTLFMGQYAGQRAEFPFLTACAKQLYDYTIEGIKLSLEMNDKLGFPFFGEFKNGRDTWEKELDEAHANIQAVINRDAPSSQDTDAKNLDEQAAREGYDGSTLPSVIALSHIQRGEVMNFIQLMANVAMGTKSAGMVKDTRELIDQWMLREKDAGKLGKVKGAPYLQLVPVPQAIALGVLHGILGKIEADTPKATIEA